MKPYKGKKPNGNGQKTGITGPRRTPHEQEIHALETKYATELEGKDKTIKEHLEYRDTLLVKVGETVGAYQLLKEKYDKLEASVSFVEKQAVKDRGDNVRIKKELEATNDLLEERTDELMISRKKKGEALEARDQARDELKAHKKTAQQALEDQEDGIDVSKLSKTDIDGLRKVLTKRVKDLNGNA